MTEASAAVQQVRLSPAVPESRRDASLCPGYSTSKPLPANVPGKAIEDASNTWASATL